MSRLESECEALREQLEAVTRERNELLKGLNSPEVVGLRAELAAAQSQFKALQEHMGKSGPWPKQIEVDQAYWQPQVETLRAQLEAVTRERDELNERHEAVIKASGRVASERDSLRAQLVEARILVRSEQHPDCVVLLRAALPWLRESWNQDLAARVAKLEAAGTELNACLAHGWSGAHRPKRYQDAIAAWDAAVKPEQP